MKFSTALFLLSLVSTSQAFVPSLVGKVDASSLKATVAKAEVSAPIISGDTQESYGKHVQSTYG